MATVSYEMSPSAFVALHLMWIAACVPGGDP